MDVEFTMEARPHAPPAPARNPAPAPRSSLACSAQLACPLSSCAVREQQLNTHGTFSVNTHKGLPTQRAFDSPSRGTELCVLMDGGATGDCSGHDDSWATAQTAAQEQTESRSGALLPPEGMAVTDGAARSAARSAVCAAKRRPGQADQSPLVSPLPPSLSSTPTRAQPPAEGAPAAADPATGRGSRPRDETDEQPRREPRPRSPPPEPMPQPPWFEEVAANNPGGCAGGCAGRGGIKSCTYAWRGWRGGPVSGIEDVRGDGGDGPRG